MESKAETDLQTSSSKLAQFLSKNTLTFEQLLSTPGIDSLIRSDIKTFVQYCKEREAFATKFIRWGILGPEQPNNQQQTMNMVFVCNSILTSEHEALSGLFIHTSREDESESSEEEENDTRCSQQRAEIAADYVYLGYLLGLIEEAMQEESYLDYLAKVLRTIASVKLPFLLTYLSDQIELYHKIVRLAHFPSVSNLLAQILTGQNRLPMKAARMREMMIPSLLSHIRQNLVKQEIYLAYECFDEVIGTLGRSSDEDQDNLQKMCNKIVCSSEIMFYVGTIMQRLEKEDKTEIDLIQLKNCVEFLIMVIKKMREDERKDSENSQTIFKPTLDYQTTELYSSFFKLLRLTSNLYRFQHIRSISYNIVPLRYLQLLLIMSKHSIFTEHYQKYAIIEKQQGIQWLILFILNRQSRGIILHMAVNLLEQILLQQERLFICNQNNQQSFQPQVILSLLDREKDRLVGRVHKLVTSPQSYSNISENQVQIRKMLIVLNNYLEAYRIKWNTQHDHLTKIIPSFTSQKCIQYAEKLTVRDHPVGDKVKPIGQFQFIFRNQRVEQTIVQIDQPKQLKTVVFKLQNKIRTHKQKVKEKNIAKFIEKDGKQQNTESAHSLKEINVHQEKVLNTETNGLKIGLVKSTSNPEANSYLPIY